MAKLETESGQGRAVVRRLRALLHTARSTDDAYLTVAVLDDSRRERALDRLDLGPGANPGRWLQRVVGGHAPSAGDVGYRVRLWRSGGAPLGGVTVRLAPGEAVDPEVSTPDPPAEAGSAREASLAARLQQATATLQAERARSRALSQKLAAERQGRQRAEQERRAAQRQLARLQAEIAEMEEVMNQATATILECCP